MKEILIFVGAFCLGLPLVRLSGWLGSRTGLTAKPKPDRWHKKPTPLLGGVGIFLSTTIVLVIYIIHTNTFPFPFIFVISSSLMFLVGLVDDIKPLNASIKLFFQIFTAILFIFVGNYQIKFFPWPFANILLTVFWLVGITNAVNLLDNMDGLAAGIAFIAAGFMVVFTWISGDSGLMLIALALAGSLLAFLIFNYPPARIFMGDSGSLFIGFTLAMLSVARRTSASNVLAVLGVPILIFLLPILDTSFVTFTRLLRGESPAQGGKDHTSHRLVSIGIGEQRVVWILYTAALCSGIAGYVLEKFNYELSIWLIPVFLIVLLLMTIFLGKITVEQEEAKARKTIYRRLPKFIVNKGVFEILLDLALVGISYYLAFWVRFGFDMTVKSVQLYVQSWPLALISVYFFSSILGIYHIYWSYIGLFDVFRIMASSIISGVGAFLLCLLVFNDPNFSIGIFGLFSLFLFLIFIGSRASYRFLEMLLESAIYSEDNDPGVTERVLIYGVNRRSDLLIRWLGKDEDLPYDVVGYIDDNALIWQKEIRGIKVWGGLDKLPELIDLLDLSGILISSNDVMDQPTDEKLDSICEKTGIWVSTVNFKIVRLKN